MRFSDWSSDVCSSDLLDQLLGVVPGTTSVGEEERHQGAGPDRAGEEAGQWPDTETEPDSDRRQDRQAAGCGQLAQGVLGDDVDDLAIFGPTRSLHDSGNLAELTAYLIDHRPGGPADGVDAEAGEEEDHRDADQQATAEESGAGNGSARKCGSRWCPYHK